MTEQQAAPSEYTPEEIAHAQAEENNLIQQQITQQVQQRNIALNIETHRAQTRAAKLEAENATLRRLLETTNAEPTPDPPVVPGTVE